MDVGDGMQSSALNLGLKSKGGGKTKEDLKSSLKSSKTKSKLKAKKGVRFDKKDRVAVIGGNKHVAAQIVILRDAMSLFHHSKSKYSEMEMKEPTSSIGRDGGMGGGFHRGTLSSLGSPSGGGMVPGVVETTSPFSPHNPFSTSIGNALGSVGRFMGLGLTRATSEPFAVGSSIGSMQPRGDIFADLLSPSPGYNRPSLVDSRSINRFFPPFCLRLHENLSKHCATKLVGGAPHRCLPIEQTSKLSIAIF